VLLRATARVVRQQPNVQLVIAGDGRDRPRLEGLVREYGLHDHLTMCGHLARPELNERLCTAWVQAVPSRYLEPFSNVLAEAMMRGTAVVATATGGSPEIVRDAVTGCLVPPGQAEALADRLLRLVADRELAERMGAAGRETALAEYTLDRMIDRFEDAYARML
jgi:glycosyltransferase involved in cell wall biosynthesis